MKRGRGRSYATAAVLPTPSLSTSSDPPLPHSRARRWVEEGWGRESLVGHKERPGSPATFRLNRHSLVELPSRTSRTTPTVDKTSSLREEMGHTVSMRTSLLTNARRLRGSSSIGTFTYWCSDEILGYSVAVWPTAAAPGDARGAASQSGHAHCITHTSTGAHLPERHLSFLPHFDCRRRQLPATLPEEAVSWVLLTPLYQLCCSPSAPCHGV